MKDRDENDDECWLGTVGWHCIHCLVRKRARPEKALQSCAALRLRPIPAHLSTLAADADGGGDEGDSTREAGSERASLGWNRPSTSGRSAVRCIIGDEMSPCPGVRERRELGHGVVRGTGGVRRSDFAVALLRLVMRRGDDRRRGGGMKQEHLWCESVCCVCIQRVCGVPTSDRTRETMTAPRHGRRPKKDVSAQLHVSAGACLAAVCATAEDGGSSSSSSRGHPHQLTSRRRPAPARSEFRRDGATFFRLAWP